MQLEYYINSIDEKEQDIKDNIDRAIKIGIDCVLSSTILTKFIKKNYSIRVGSFVDYPLGFCDQSRRLDLISDAINSGADYISMCLPFYYIINRKYTKFREDISSSLELCTKYKVELRYILEYRKFDHLLLQKTCDILKTCGINIVYPSTGLFIDNIEDNIVACAYLQQKTGIHTIVNGNIWNKNHVDAIVKFKPIGISTNQIESLYLLNNS